MTPSVNIDLTRVARDVGLAPAQVVMIPILSKKAGSEVLAHCATLKEELEAAGIRVIMDERDLRPGNKFYHWELRGVPLRMEVGPRDMESGTVMLVRRDDMSKSQVPRDSAIDEVGKVLDDIQASLYDRAKQALEAGIQEPGSPAEVQDDVPVIRCGWCGDMDCAKTMEADTDRAFLGFPLEDDESRVCLNCGKPNGRTVYLSRMH